jgi:DNA-binding response OmpR family regulator
MPGEKLLLVDDDSWLLESMSQWLVEQGYRVWTVRTIKQAQSQFQSERFDLCLVDVCLEREEGFDLLRWIVKHDAAPSDRSTKNRA